MLNNLKIIGAIVGGIVAGLAVMAIIFGVAVWGFTYAQVHLFEGFGVTIVQTCDDGSIINHRDKCVTK